MKENAILSFFYTISVLQINCSKTHCIGFAPLLTLVLPMVLLQLNDEEK